MSTTMHHGAGSDPDPIDALVPPPRSTAVRLAIGVAIAALVGTGAFLWGFGYVVARPECCGTGGSSAIMSLSPDGEAVTVTASFYNSSGRQVTIESATADLPGAHVFDITLLDPDNNVYPTGNVQSLPATVAATSLSRLLVTFTPMECTDTNEAWGSVTLKLTVGNSWLPTFGRTYELPNPVVSLEPNDLTVFEPESLDGTPPQTPLAAACALLGR